MAESSKAERGGKDDGMISCRGRRLHQLMRRPETHLDQAGEDILIELVFFVWLVRVKGVRV